MIADLESVLRRLAGSAPARSLRVALRRTRTPAEHWGREPQARGAGAERHWTELTQVREILNRRVSGDPAVDPYMHVLRTRLEGRLPVASALTIGCGEGELERGLSGHGFSERHDALDVAPAAVERAAAAARGAGLGHLRYRVEDANHLRLDPASYDVVFGVHSIHHVRDLEHLLGQVAGALRPDGLLVLDEYVGPSRFQWSERQLEVAGGLLRALPEDLRVSLVDGRVRRKVRRPSVAEVIATDPSEAVRSDEILAVVASLFEVLEVRPYGGTILHPLLDDIAGNFARPDGPGRELLAAIADVEWALVGSGFLTSDFALVVARPKGAGRAET